MTLKVVFELGASFSAFLTQLGNLYMPAFDELVAKIDDIATTLETFKAEVSAAITSEGEQVAAAIAGLEAHLGNVLTPAEFAAVGDKLDTLKAAASLDGLKTAVAAIYELPAPPQG